MTIKSKHHQCSAPDIELPACVGNIRKIPNLQVYHYDEMIKRLNSVNKDEMCTVGYFLRMLWDRHRKDLVMHANNIYSEQHEQYQKANRSEFEKKHRKGEIGFRKNENGIWGVYSDLLYDTYQKDWSKAYQLTFYCFFRNIDFLCKPAGWESFSCAHDNQNVFIANDKECQFGEIVIEDVMGLVKSGKADKIHGLPMHSKAPLYDIISGVLEYKKYPEKDVGRFRHGHGYWLGGAKDGGEDFPKRLAMNFFAHMASAAVVNPLAFKAMSESLSNSHGMFMDALKCMALRLGGSKGGSSSGWETTAKIPHLPPLTIYNPFSDEIHRGILRERFPNKSEEEIMRMDKIKIMDQGFLKENIPLRERIENDIDSARLYVGCRYLVVDIVQHHLHMAKTANGRREEYYELTYVYNHFCDKHYYRDNNEKNHEVYEGYHDEKREKEKGKGEGHTMGPKFSRLVDQHKPGMVIHLHPLLVDDLGHWLRKEPYQTMFSVGDQDYFSWKSLWIGIQPFKEGNKYYVDTYLSRESWGKIIKKEDVGRCMPGTEGKRFPGMHMERIEGLIPKFCDNLKIYKATEVEVKRCE